MNLIAITIHSGAHFVQKVLVEGMFFEFDNMKPFEFNISNEEIDLNKERIVFAFYSQYYN